MTSAARAENAAPPTRLDESPAEIIVTARRVKENLQEAPASISYLNRATIQSAAVVSLADASRLVPNLSYMPNYRQGLFNISLRGVSTVQGGEAPVAVLVDGVQAPGLDFINQDLLELESIQVLRGPQGALYGRGAIAGAVLISTAQPTDMLSNHTHISIGNGRTIRALNTVSGPLERNVGFTLTTVARYSRGLIEDIGLGRPADHSSQAGARGSLIFAPSEGLSVTLTGSYLRAREGASYLSAATVDELQALDLFPSRNLDTTDRREIYSTSLKIEKEVSIGTLTSVSQYAHSTSRVFGDADWTPVALAQQRNDIDVRAFNQDLRLSSPEGRSFRWLVGAFYQHRRTHDFLFVDGDRAGPLSGVTLAAGNNFARSEAYAAYAQIGIDLPSHFNLTAALRYDVDRRRDEDRLVVGSRVSRKFDAWQPQLTIGRPLGRHLNAYATVGRGFRSGGFNAFADALNIPGIPRSYAAEFTTNYEAGLKSSFLDGRLTINGALFHTKFENQQVGRLNASPPARDIVNIDSKTDGGELEIRAIPLDRFTLAGGVGINRARIMSGPLRGNHTPNSYASTVNASAEYVMPLTGGWDASARVDYARNGPIYYDPANTARFHSTNFVNGSIRMGNGIVSAGFWGKNIFGEKAPAMYGPDGFSPGVGPLQRIQPATYGIDLDARF